MPSADNLAFRIYQAILDGSGDAVNLRDFDRFVPFFLIPSVLETFEGRRVIETPNAMRATFDKLQQILGDIGAVRMERVCTIAQFDGDNTIRGVHNTQLVDGVGTVLETYSGMCTLRLIDGHWRTSVSQFLEKKASIPSKILRAGMETVRALPEPSGAQ